MFTSFDALRQPIEHVRLGFSPADLGGAERFQEGGAVKQVDLRSDRRGEAFGNALEAAIGISLPQPVARGAFEIPKQKANGVGLFLHLELLGEPFPEQPG